MLFIAFSWEKFLRGLNFAIFTPQSPSAQKLGIVLYDTAMPLGAAHDLRSDQRIVVAILIGSRLYTALELRYIKAPQTLFP